MYKGINFITYKEKASKANARTDEPLKWFPELAPLFKNFNIKSIEIELEIEEDEKNEIAAEYFFIKKEK